MPTIIANYRQIKEQYPDHVLIYRIGDFYEALEADAGTFAYACNLHILTRVFDAERVKMAGVPYHCIDGYVRLLVSKGYKVALAEMDQRHPDTVDVKHVINAQDA